METFGFVFRESVPIEDLIDSRKRIGMGVSKANLYGESVNLTYMLTLAS